MKMIHILLVLFAGLTSFLGWSNTQLRLKGTIGKATVYLELSEEGTEYFGRYYYKNQLIDIPLKGALKSGVYSFETNYDEFYGSPEIKEFLVFKKSGEKYIGNWSRNGKRLSVSFTVIKPNEFVSKRLANNPVLHELKLSGIDLFKLDLFNLSGKDSVIIDQGLTWRSFTETHTGLEMPRIDSGLPDGKQKVANQYLERTHIQRFLEMLDCSAAGGELTDFGYSYSIEVIDESILSLSFFNYFMCVGMMHPEEANYAVIIDLEQGKELKNTDFLNENAFEMDQDENEAFQVLVYNYFKKTLPELFDETTEEEAKLSGDDCEFNRIELWTADMEMHLTRDGLKLLPYFPHIMAPCLEPEWAVVPYIELKDLLKESYYTRLVGIKH